MENDTLKLLRRARSYRRFDAARTLSEEELSFLVEAARVTGSTANLQRVRFALFADRTEKDLIFSGLRFAGYLTDWKGPTTEERPGAYIVLATAGEPDANLCIDLGMAAQSIQVAAASIGLGGCILRSFDKKTVTEKLMPEGYVPQLVIALGAPAEKVVLTDAVDGNIRYFRQEDGTHVVPKLALSDLILPKKTL